MSDVKEKKKIVVEVNYTDGKVDDRKVTITKWTEREEKTRPPFEVKGIQQ